MKVNCRRFGKLYSLAVDNTVVAPVPRVRKKVGCLRIETAVRVPERISVYALGSRSL